MCAYEKPLLRVWNRDNDEGDTESWGQHSTYVTKPVCLTLDSHVTTNATTSNHNIKVLRGQRVCSKLHTAHSLSEIIPLFTGPD
jgi:hypothetical protein